MQYLGLLATIAELYIILWGAMLLVGGFFRNRWMALVGAPWVFATTTFCIESYRGLGSLRGVGFLFAILSIVLIWLSCDDRWVDRIPAGWRPSARAWRACFHPRELWVCGAIFGGIFLYAFAWRFAFPDVDGSSEKIADLSYISSYLPGSKIPVVDAWFYPYLSTQYYSFQHYSAALMGRLLGLDPGTTYNLGFCCLIAFAGTTFAGTIWSACTGKLKRLLLLAGFVFGGTGATLVVHLTDQQVSPWSAMRYVGSAPNDKGALGAFLAAYAARYPKMDLPGEPFSYSIYLGDYHAPLGGFYVLTLGVLAGLLWSQTAQKRYVGLVGASLTWTLLTNSWSLPLQGLAVLSWLVYYRKQWRTLIPPLIAGAALVWFAAAVYLYSFTAASAGYKTALKLVPWADHTPPLQFLIFLFPTIALAVLGLFSGRKHGIWLGLTSLAFLFFSEFFYVDDIYSGMYERFNTTLKWWPWIVAGTLLTLGPVLLDKATRPWVRICAIIFCAYPIVYVADLASFWVKPEKLSFGKFNGTGFLDRDLASHLMLDRLKRETPGVVIERPKKDSFTNSACLPLFAGHKMWLGWLAHEQLWRGYREDLAQRQERLFQFYNGEMSDPARWLRAQGIDYAIWFQPEDSAALWEKVDHALEPDYIWSEIYTTPDGAKIGFWKASQPKLSAAVSSTTQN